MDNIQKAQELIYQEFEKAWKEKNEIIFNNIKEYLEEIKDYYEEIIKDYRGEIKLEYLSSEDLIRIYEILERVREEITKQRIRLLVIQSKWDGKNSYTKDEKGNYKQVRKTYEEIKALGKMGFAEVDNYDRLFQNKLKISDKEIKEIVADQKREYILKIIEDRVFKIREGYQSAKNYRAAYALQKSKGKNDALIVGDITNNIEKITKVYQKKKRLDATWSKADQYNRYNRKLQNREQFYYEAMGEQHVVWYAYNNQSLKNNKIFPVSSDFLNLGRLYESYLRLAAEEKINMENEEDNFKIDKYKNLYDEKMFSFRESGVENVPFYKDADVVFTIKDVTNNITHEYIQVKANASQIRLGTLSKYLENFYKAFCLDKYSNNYSSMIEIWRNNSKQIVGLFVPSTADLKFYPDKELRIDQKEMMERISNFVGETLIGQNYKTFLD